MAESCTINTYIRNKEGKVVESKLWNDLITFTDNNRTLTQQYYALGTDSRFLENVRNKAIFDENGEITFESLRKLAKLKFSNDDVFDKVSSSIRATSLTFDEALNSINSFNSNSQFKNEYLATITEASNGTYSVTLVNKTKDSVKKLEDILKKKELQDFLIQKLNELGVNVEFLETSRYRGQYSTRPEDVEAIEKNYRTVYTLIRIAKNLPIDKQNKALAKEIGHFVIGAMKDTSLLNRLEEALKPDVVSSYVRYYEEDSVLAANNKREIMGHLIGDAILDRLEKNEKSSPIRNLLDRIKAYILSKFSKYKNEADLLLALDKVNSLVKDAAKGFAKNTLNLEVKKALETEETLYDAEQSDVYKALREIAARRQLMINQIKKLDYKYGKHLQEKLDEVIQKFKYNDALTDENLRFLHNALQIIMLDINSEVKGLGISLETFDNNISDYDIKHDFVTYGNKLQAIGLQLKYLTSCANLINQVLGSKEMLRFQISSLVTGTTGATSLRGLYQDINNVLTSVTGGYSKHARRYGGLFLSNWYGDSVMTIVGGVKFGKTKVGEKSKLYVAKDKTVTMEELLKSIDTDLNSVEYLTSSIGRTHDIPMQLLAKAIDATNESANQETYQLIQTLFNIRKKYNFSKKEILELYERYENGDLTGNLVTDVHYGNYEKDLEEFKNECKKVSTKEEEKGKFQKYIERKYGTNWENIQEYERAAQWAIWYKKEWKKFHYGTSHTEQDGQGNLIVVHDNARSINRSGVLIPNINYKDRNGNRRYYNPAFEKLSNEQVNLLREILQIKRALDDRLGNANVTNVVRAPQIEGTLANRITNKLPENKLKTFGNWMFEKFFVQAKDTDFGNDITLLNREQWYGMSYEAEKKRIEEIPFFFINKLKDTNKLSTDLFGSMMAYASMAITYGNMSSLKGSVDVLSYAMNNRTITNPTREGIVDNLLTVNSQNSRMTHSLRVYLENNMYSKSVNSRLMIGKLCGYKILAHLNRLNSILRLGGNLFGAAVNDATGFNEIWQEAFTGEDLNSKSVAKAHALYIKNLPILCIDAFKRMPTDKVSAWYNYFNVRGDNAFQYKNKDTFRSPLTISELVMSPYSAGDHYMQGMSYLATALDMTVYDKDGNAHKFYDIYDNNDGILSLKEGIWFTSKNFLENYAIYNSILEKITRALGTVENMADIITIEERTFLLDNNIQFENLKLKDLLVALENLKNKSTVNKEFEDTYMKKCRDVNNRLHGIYDKANKTVIHNSIFGNFLLAFKGYLLGYIERDFAPGRYDVNLGRYAEGRYVTLYKFLAANFLKDEDGNRMGNIWKMLGGSLGSMLYFIPGVKQGLENNWRNVGLNEAQVNNMKRIGFKTDLIIILETLAALCLMVGQGDKDDPDDDKLVFLWLYYILSRASFEQRSATLLAGSINNIIEGSGFTNWLIEANRNTPTMPMNVMLVPELINFAIQIGGDVIAPEDSKWYEKAHYKSSKNISGDYDSSFGRMLHGEYSVGDPKWVRQAIMYCPFIKSIPIAAHPVEGYERWVYGQSIRR